MDGPVRALSGAATEEKGEHARLSSFVGALALCDMVKTTLGPKGMDKILQPMEGGKDIIITNDGATILKSITVDNAAAKILIDVAKSQDEDSGDGTTSVVVLCGELLHEAEKLIDARLHPQTIIEGYRMATDIAREALTAAAEDHGDDEEQFRIDLINIARTTLSSKVLNLDRDHFAELAVDAVLKGSTDLENIGIIKIPGGSLRDSYLADGFILQKKIGVGQPKRIEGAKILIANTAMDTDKIKIFGSKVRVDSSTKLAEIEDAERDRMKRKVKKIIDHGINVFINRQLIYNLPEQIFAENGVMAIEHADFEGIERLAYVTGGEIASTFEHPELVKLGTCEVIEEVLIGEDRVIKFSGVARGEARTIVLRGASAHLLEEAERSLHDALCVISQTVKETGTVYGGGCSEMLMAKAVDELALKTSGKKALAIEAFARGLRGIPAVLCDNAGYDSLELVAQLRASHATETSAKPSHGLDMTHGTVGDMRALGIVESFKVKRQVLLSAAEACEMIVRVDDILRAAPREREGQGMPGMPPGMGMPGMM